MAHKVLPTPSSGSDPNHWYGTDNNKLINMLTGASSADPFTLHVDVHTFKHSTTNAAGDLLKGDGTRLNRLARGTANQVLRVNAGGTDVEWGSVTGGWDPAASETITNKTINATNNTITDTSTAAGDLFKSNGTKFVRFARGTALQQVRVNSGATDLEYFTAASATETQTNKTINTTDNTITATSQATGDILKNNGTKFVRMARGTASQVLATNPAGTDLEWVTLSGSWSPSAAETLTNKTINTTDNSITATSQAAGDILKNNGTKFVRLARGTSLQVLRVNSGGTDVEWGAAPGSSITETSTTTFTNKTFGDAIRADKITVPADQTDVEEYQLYSKTVDTNNNGLFIKIKKGGIIQEIQLI